MLRVRAQRGVLGFNFANSTETPKVVLFFLWVDFDENEDNSAKNVRGRGCLSIRHFGGTSTERGVLRVKHTTIRGIGWEVSGVVWSEIIKKRRKDGGGGKETKT